MISTSRNVDFHSFGFVISFNKNIHKRRLAELGFTFPDSQANFIFATHRKAGAEGIFQALKEKQIYVRYFKTPGLNNSLRITIGTDEEMDRLFDELKRIIKEV